MNPSSYTLLWTNDYCRRLRKAGDRGRPLRVLFGGSHLSQPGLTRFGAAPGDYIYPIRVENGILHLVSRMQIRTFVGVAEYLTQTLGLDAAHSEGHIWEVSEKLGTEHPEWGHLLPWGCVQEVALGDDGFPIDFRRFVPPELVPSLRYETKGGERPIKHVDEEGFIKSTVSLQGGLYRLTPSSAQVFESVLLAQIGGSTRRWYQE